MCKTNVLTTTQIYYDLCLDNPKSYSLSDLTTPVRFFTQGLRTGLCVYYNNAPANISSYDIISATTVQGFNQLIQDKLGIKDPFNNKNYYQSVPFINNTIPKIYSSLVLNSTTVAGTKFIMNYRVLSD